MITELVVYSCVTSIHKKSESTIANRAVLRATLMPPSIAFPTVYYLLFIVVLLRADETEVFLEIIFCLGLPFRSILVVTISMPLDFMIKTLVKSFELLDSITDAIVEILIALRLLMALTVYLEKRFVVSLYHIYLQIVPFGAFRVIGSSTAFIRTWNCHSYHVATDQA